MVFYLLSEPYGTLAFYEAAVRLAELLSSLLMFLNCEPKTGLLRISATLRLESPTLVEVAFALYVSSEFTTLFPECVGIVEFSSLMEFFKKLRTLLF